MKILTSSTELPTELEGFAGGMGYKSIASITESELGFDVNEDVKAAYHFSLISALGAIKM